MKAAALHALEQDQLPACIGDRDRDRNPGFFGDCDRRGHHFLRARIGQALCIGYVHRLNLRRLCLTGMIEDL